MSKAAAADFRFVRTGRGGRAPPFALRLQGRDIVASSDRRLWRATARARCGALLALLALLAGGPVATARADGAAPIAAPMGAPFTAWAMHWFIEMMAGRTDRAQYAPAFAPEVTDRAIAGIARDLNAYGAAPLRAEIVRTKTEGGQTFAIVKFVFPRGDATSLVFGFDPAGRITGIAPGGMAGD